MVQPLYIKQHLFNTYFSNWLILAVGLYNYNSYHSCNSLFNTIFAYYLEVSPVAFMGLCGGVVPDVMAFHLLGELLEQFFI